MDAKEADNFVSLTRNRSNGTAIPFFFATITFNIALSRVCASGICYCCAS